MDSSGSVIFEPMRVPMATPLECLAAVRATASSGNEVPIAVIVAPINDGGIDIAPAIVVAEFTRTVAEHIARDRPTTTLASRAKSFVSMT